MISKLKGQKKRSYDIAGWSLNNKDTIPKNVYL